MNTKKFLAFGFVIIGIAVGFYAYLGGFNQTKITQVISKTIYIAGAPYNGSLKNETFGKLFEKAGKLVEEKQVAGELGGIYYNNPEKSNDSISAFIGIVIPDTTVKLPAGYSIRTVPAGKYILEAKLNAHYMLAPGKLYPALFDYAKSNNLQLQDYFVEYYPTTRHAAVQVFLAE